MLAAVFLMQSVARILVDGLSLGILEAISQRWNLPSSESGSDLSKLVVDQVWRWTVGIGILPAAVAIVMRMTIPETPRYYAGILKDLRKAVKNTLMVYPKSVSEKPPTAAETAPAVRHGSGEDTIVRWHEWYVGAWEYLAGPTKAWRTLGAMSLLWAILDFVFYGLSMDLSHDLSIMAHNPATDTSTCPNNPVWNPDWWNCDPKIYHVLRMNSLRLMWLASLPSVVGGIAAVLAINYVRRKHMLAATFLAISILLAAAGASLLITTHMNETHVVTEVIYALLSFVFNLGPNTLVFVTAAEVFPTVYRSTFFGLSAASGKMGAAVVRVIVSRTLDREASLGIRLLAFVPLMLAAAVLSWYLPDVQTPTTSRRGDGAVEEEARQLDSDGTAVLRQQAASIRNSTRRANGVDQDHQASRRSSESSFGQSGPLPELETRRKPRGLFGRVRNRALEDIAPNPARQPRL